MAALVSARQTGAVPIAPSPMNADPTVLVMARATPAGASALTASWEMTAHLLHRALPTARDTAHAHSASVPASRVGRVATAAWLSAALLTAPVCAETPCRGGMGLGGWIALRRNEIENHDLPGKSEDYSRMGTACITLALTRVRLRPQVMELATPERATVTLAGLGWTVARQRLAQAALLAGTPKQYAVEARVQSGRLLLQPRASW